MSPSQPLSPLVSGGRGESCELTSRGQCCLTHESRQGPEPPPLLAWLLLNCLVSALLLVSGEAGVLGAGVCPSLILGIQILCSACLTPGTSPSPSFPGHRRCGEYCPCCSAAPGSEERAAGTVEGAGGLGKDEGRLNLPQT